jgi:AcrR family transcriptional regulator
MTTARRGPGRPRAVAAAAGTDAREQILDAAAALFLTNGYAATGTREIAAAAGLRPASLFYWFARKEDILVELLDRTVTPALAVSDVTRRRAAGPDVGLFALARSDVLNLCSGEHNLAALQLLAEARAEPFAAFWARRAELRSRYRELLVAVDQAGRLVPPTVDLATDIVFGTVESVITWFDRVGAVPADVAADVVATTVVRGVVARAGSVRRLRAGADRLVAEGAGACSVGAPRRRTDPRARG